MDRQRDCKDTETHKCISCFFVASRKWIDKDKLEHFGEKNEDNIQLV